MSPLKYESVIQLPPLFQQSNGEMRQQTPAPYVRRRMSALNKQKAQSKLGDLNPQLSLLRVILFPHEKQCSNTVHIIV